MQQFIKVTVEKLFCLEIHSIFISFQLGIFHSPQKEKKNQRIKRKGKKKPLHGDYNQRSVMFNLQGDLFLFPILYFPPFHSFMSPWYKLFTSRRWWRWDQKYFPLDRLGLMWNKLLNQAVTVSSGSLDLCFNIAGLKWAD